MAMHQAKARELVAHGEAGAFGYQGGLDKRRSDRHDASVANPIEFFLGALRNLREQNQTLRLSGGKPRCRNHLFASLAVSAAIALALIAQLILMFASPPQLVTLAVPMPVSFPVTVAIYANAARSNLDLLRIRRNGGEKSRSGGDDECIFVH
jgi:hypothetical protein